MRSSGAADRSVPVTARSYLDHAAHSPLRPRAAEAWLATQDVVGNPSGLHGSARRARAMLEDARELLAERIGAHPTELVLTSGGSESDTLAVLGGAATMRARGRARVLVSVVEHPAVLGVTRHLPEATTVPVDSTGRLDLGAARRLVDERCGLLSVQLVNNEHGTLQPVDEAAELAHRHGALFHTDAVQGLLWPGLDLGSSPADLVSLSGHKVGAPVGVGLLVVRRHVELVPVGLGGGQERGIRSGTPAVALASALAAAVDDLVSHRDEELARLRLLGDRVRSLLVNLPGTSLRGGAGPHPGIVAATFEGLRADDLLLLLDRQGVDASVGSACRAGVHQPSEVVLASGGSMEEALGTVRFSLGHSSTAADVDRLANALPAAVEAARAAAAT